MKTASFKTSRQDAKTIGEIATRAVSLARKYDVDYDRLTAEMDLTACHANGCELDLPQLLAFDDFNFAHDILGIRRHINRTTGELEGFFLPRCARA